MCGISGEGLLTKLTETAGNYAIQEQKILIDIIKSADADTRRLLFPNAVCIDGAERCFNEVSARLISYCLFTIHQLGFEKCFINMNYENDVGKYFLVDGYEKWKVVLDEYVKAVYASGVTQEVWDDFAGCVSTAQYACGMLQKMDFDSAVLPRMVYGIVKTHCSQEKLDCLCKSWLGTLGDRMSIITGYEPFESYRLDPILTTPLSGDINALVNTLSEDKKWDEAGNSYYSGVGMYGVYETIHHEHKVYGQNVVDWINGVPKRYAIVSGQTADNVVDTSQTETHTVSPSSGCVIGSTMIKLFDHSEKKITELTEGECVLSKGNIASELSDEFVVNKSITALYGFNEFEPFMSLEHAVMTDSGWKSLDPGKSNEINANYDVTLLEEGDIVHCFDKKVKVEKINVCYAREGELFTGYDIHVREGSHSYYANGILVLENYPEITVHRVLSRLAQLDEQEQRKFVKLLGENNELISKIFGNDAIDNLKERLNTFL